MKHSGYFKLSKPGHNYLVWFDTSTSSGAIEPCRSFSDRAEVIKLLSLPEINIPRQLLASTLNELERSRQAQLITKEICLTDEQLSTFFFLGENAT